jgi:cytochrome c oxidase subunit 2
MSLLHNKMTRGLAGLALALGVSNSALAEYRLNFQEPVTAIGHQVYSLHMMIFWICVVIAIVVFGVMFYSMYAHRKSRGAVAADFHENTKLEIIWTIIPFVILISMAIPATSALINYENTADADLTVKITGMQWKWKYEYTGEGEGVKMISALVPEQYNAAQKEGGKGIEKFDPHGDTPYLLTVDHELVLPVGKKVRFLITSDDVIHSWWVPQLATKKDAIPGFVNETWTKIDKPGRYRGDCAELCGKDHAFMPIVVHAVAESDFKTWLADAKTAAAAAAAEAASGKEWSKDELMAKGKEIFTGKGGCFGCHGMNGEGVATFPHLAGAAIANGTDHSAHITTVVHGRPGTAMAAYGNQLNDLELAAVITYERNSWGNTGGIVQPKDIKSAR